MKATWNGVILAESDDTIVVENNHYFPADAIKKQYFSESTHTSHCPWKGTASYFSIDVAAHRNDNAAWYYPEPLEAAASIRGRVAFWKGVEIGE